MKVTMPSKSPNTAKTKSLGIILLVLVSLSAGFVGGWAGSRNRNLTLGSSDEVSQRIVSSESQVISDIAKNVGPSVVSINVVSQQNTVDFFGNERVFEAQAAGTGVIISADVIVTNRHVIGTATSGVSVTLFDGTELTDVEIIGKTSANDPLDIAFLRVKDKKGKELKPATLGDSEAMQVGDKVVAIGNALGEFQNTVTSGILSGYGRSVVAGDETGSETLQNLLQTDAAINQGNSGGPLVNISSEVIGINTAIAGEGAENIGFAIPINDIKGLIKSVLEKGKLERPYLGVRYVVLDENTAETFGTDVKKGVYIVPQENRSQASIVPGSPAAKAGLQEGDIITHVDGQEINEQNSLTSLIAQHSVGDEVELTIIRDGQEQKVKVTLEAAPTS